MPPDPNPSESEAATIGRVLRAVALKADYSFAHGIFVGDVRRLLDMALENRGRVRVETS